MAEEKKAFRSHFGFYIASMGSAIGLGNLWRFPYVVADYGGGAFVFLYILLTLFFGVPLLISEISLGKYLNLKGITLNELVKKSDYKYAFVLKKLLWVPLFVSFLVLSYYCVLSAWTLHLISRSISSYILEAPFRGELSFLSLKHNFFLQALLLSVHLIIVFLLAIKGLKAGVEKWLVFVIPVFVAYLLFVSTQLFAREDIFNAAKYIVYPNFHLLSFKSFSYALGHVLFTMSVGFGVFVSLGSYLPSKSSAGTASVRVAIMDTFVSLCIGFVIFPVVIASAYTGKMSEALFRAVPNFMESSDVSILMSTGFYICVLIAAINASLALVESIVYRLKDSMVISRKGAVFAILSLTFVIGISVIFANKFWLEYGDFLEVLDDVAINILLPLAAIVISFLVLKVVDKSFIKKDFEVNEHDQNSIFYKVWCLFLYFIMPILYFISLALRLF